MCGRFALAATRDEVAAAFNAWIAEAFPCRYNIAPTQPILAIRSPESYRSPQSNYPPHDSLLVRWGFIPAWTKQPDSWPLTFNIRSETVYEKKSFRNALHYQRVIIPASGFYEWKKRSGKKSQPYYIYPDDKSIFGFAGLMETWSGAEGSQVDTAAILTCAAKPHLSSIHHRMPVIIEAKDVTRWLDCRNYRPEDVRDILQKTNASNYLFHPISEKINNAGYWGSDVLEPVKLENNERIHSSGDKKQLDLF